MRLKYTHKAWVGVEVICVVRRFFLKSKLSTGKHSIIDTIYDSKADELAEVIGCQIGDTTESVLKIIEGIDNTDLRRKLKDVYLHEEDLTGNECGRLIKEYYNNRIQRRSKSCYRMR